MIKDNWRFHSSTPWIGHLLIWVSATNSSNAFHFLCLKSTDLTNTSFTDDGKQSLRCFQFKSHMNFKIGKSYKTHPLVFSFIRLPGWLRSSSLGCLFAALPARALVVLMLLMVAHPGTVPCHCWEWSHLWELKTLNHGLFSSSVFCQPFSEFLLKFLALACGPFLVSSTFSTVVLSILSTEATVPWLSCFLGGLHCRGSQLVCTTDTFFSGV